MAAGAQARGTDAERRRGAQMWINRILFQILQHSA